MEKAIKDYGNMGNLGKVTRILKAIEIARKNDCAITIVLDTAVYGKMNLHKFPAAKVQQLDFALCTSNLYVLQGKDVITTIPWWDITKIHIIF